MMNPEAEAAVFMAMRISSLWSEVHAAIAALARADKRAAGAVLDQVLREAAKLRAEGDGDVQ